MDEKVIWGPDDFFEYLNGSTYDMKADVITFPEDGSVPLTHNFSFDLDKVLGRVENIHLVGDDTLVGTPYFFNPDITDEVAEEMFKEMRLGGYFSDVHMIDKLGPHGGKTITEARLRGLSLVMFKDMPERLKAEVDDDSDAASV
jgi:hypothetical protein